MDLDATADQAPEPLDEAPLAHGQPPAKAGGGWVEEGVEILKTIAYALVIVLVVRVLLIQPFTIPSGSMIPNLQIGDYIVVSKFSYGFSRYSIPLSLPLFKGRILGRDPKPGDIVVFKFPNDPKVDYVKRMIGLPGDRIQVLDGKLFLNDKPVSTKILPRTPDDLADSLTRAIETLPNGKSYITQDLGPYSSTDNTTIFLVPQHMYFMMGDNRDNSSDSRVDPNVGGVGFVPAENLVGKAQIILGSWTEGVSLFKPWTWVTKARGHRFFHLLN
jgi:signal peptidase I